MPVPSSGTPDGVPRSRPQPARHWRRHPRPAAGVYTAEAEPGPVQCISLGNEVHITNQGKGAPGAMRGTAYVTTRGPGCHAVLWKPLFNPFLK